MLAKQLETKTWTPMLHCADCLDSMREMPAGSVDLVVTSPPYNLSNTTGGGMKNAGTGKWTPLLKDGYDGHDDNMPHDQYVAWQRECLTEMMRLLSDNG
ncbi:MAG TPA: DNA methyltransferase, partial [Nitrososphaera sp.]|nr:DNA methyltransferase [Nitrososphaera sp.]